ncbi:MAG: PLP-dependent aspartate aminotransferase family protein [Chloroflexota bacterium]
MDSDHDEDDIDPRWRPATLSVHAGQAPDAATGAVAPPIYQTSTFAQDAVGKPRGGWEYARSGNPIRSRLERAIAVLEGGRHGLAWASGAATTAAIAGLLRPGEQVVLSDDVYGGTFRLFDQVLDESGVEAIYVDLCGSGPGPGERLAQALSERTRLVWIESPSNPWLKLIDLRAVAQAAHAHRGARGEPPIVIVDNTFASPFGQRPLELGADISFHSATKYLGGHSDTINGVLATSRDDLYERLRFLQNATGAVPGPFDCFLVLRGLRTLSLRMERHSSNAARVSEALASRSDVELVRYPGLRSGPQAHPQAELATKQMRLAGGMVSFMPAALRGRSAEERAHRFSAATKVFILAESLGGVESLVEVPAVMTHGSVQGSSLEIPAGLVRLSVGIEDPEDLVTDISEALDLA